jgi:hypothetical protein
MQNQTPTPDILDLLISFSPVIVLGIFGIKDAWQSSTGKILLVWFLSSVLLIFVPWNLSRRFLTGIYVPLGGMAVFGLSNIISRFNYSIRTGFIVLLILIIPTNIIVLGSGIQAIKNRDLNIYYSSDLEDCFLWIKSNTDENSLILAEEKVGLIIPSRTGRRVIYGHPFETVNAEQELKFVEGIYESIAENSLRMKNLDERNINYLLVSGEDWGNSNMDENERLVIVYQSPTVKLFQVISQ